MILLRHSPTPFSVSCIVHFDTICGIHRLYWPNWHWRRHHDHHRIIHILKGYILDHQQQQASQNHKLFASSNG
jgi:hypothetical protein